MFQCPQCGEPALAIEAGIELASAAEWDERRLQVLTCGSCGLAALAVYLESRRGAGERVVHSALPVSPERAAELHASIAACPHRDNSYCDCPSHRTLAVLEWEPSVPGVFEVQIAHR